MANSSKAKSITIEFSENGPILVKGLRKITGSDGNEIETKESFALCRCGASSNKPFCDGTHTAVEFSGKRDIDKPLDKEKSYQGTNITIHDNRRICSHAMFCVDRLPAVFKRDAQPWIDPNGAEAQAVIELVEQCPSGALSYSIEGVHHRDVERQPKIEVEKGGPYYVQGGIEMKHNLQPPSKEHYALCRCGASKNKPFCDGAHHDVEFD